MIGVDGATLSMLNATVAAFDVLPAASVAVTEIVCAPCGRSALGVHDHEPLLGTLSEQYVVVPSLTSRDEFASAVPLIVGLVTFSNASAVGDDTVGVAGATVSTVKETDVDATDLLVARSACVADRVCAPSVSAGFGVHDHVLLVVTVAVHTTASDLAVSMTVTVARPSPVPLMVGAASFVNVPELGAPITGAAGATVSMLNDRVL